MSYNRDQQNFTYNLLDNKSVLCRIKDSQTETSRLGQYFGTINILNINYVIILWNDKIEPQFYDQDTIDLEITYTEWKSI